MGRMGVVSGSPKRMRKQLLLLPHSHILIHVRHLTTHPPLLLLVMYYWPWLKPYVPEVIRLSCYSVHRMIIHIRDRDSNTVIAYDTICHNNRIYDTEYWNFCTKHRNIMTTKKDNSFFWIIFYCFISIHRYPTNNLS